MSFKTLLIEKVEDGVAMLTLHRPDVLNAINLEVKRELSEALTGIEENPEIRALVITGSGEKAFSAGGDVHELAQLTPEEITRGRQLSLEFIWRLANLKVPTIGAINGLAYGGGALLASALDIRVGCERTKFRFLAVQYGRLNCTWTLPAVVGLARAKELIYTGRVVAAQEAERIGLLNEVVPADNLVEAAKKKALEIAKNVPAAVQGAKVLFNESMGKSWRELQRAEDDMVTTGFKPTPIEEGFAEFLAKKGGK